MSRVEWFALCPVIARDVLRTHPVGRVESRASSRASGRSYSILPAGPPARAPRNGPPRFCPAAPKVSFGALRPAAARVENDGYSGGRNLLLPLRFLVDVIFDQDAAGAAAGVRPPGGASLRRALRMPGAVTAREGATGAEPETGTATALWV